MSSYRFLPNTRLSLCLDTGAKVTTLQYNYMDELAEEIIGKVYFGGLGGGNGYC